MTSLTRLIAFILSLKTVDLSGGIRENWDAKQKWRAAISKLVAAQRFRANSDAAHSRRRSAALSDASTDSASSFETYYGSAENGSEPRRSVDRVPEALPDQDRQMTDLSNRTAKIAVR